MLEKRDQLLIALSRDLKYVYDVELVFPLDKLQFCSIFNMFRENYNKPRLPETNTEPGFVFVCREYIKDPTNMKLVKGRCPNICTIDQAGTLKMPYF